MRNLPFEGEDGVVLWVNRTEAVIPMGRRSGQKKYRKLEVAGSMHGMQGTYNNIFWQQHVSSDPWVELKKKAWCCSSALFCWHWKKVSSTCLVLLLYSTILFHCYDQGDGKKNIEEPRKVPLLWREALLILILSIEYFVFSVFSIEELFKRLTVVLFPAKWKPRLNSNLG